MWTSLLRPLLVPFARAAERRAQRMEEEALRLKAERIREHRQKKQDALNARRQQRIITKNACASMTAPENIARNAGLRLSGSSRRHVARFIVRYAKRKIRNGSRDRTRTCNPPVNSRLLYH